MQLPDRAQSGITVLVENVDHPEWATVTRLQHVRHAARGRVHLVQHHEALRVGSEHIRGGPLTHSARRAVFSRHDHSLAVLAHVVTSKVADGVSADTVAATASGEPFGLNRHCINVPLLIETRYAGRCTAVSALSACP